MPRNTRSSQLETRTARLKLAIRWKPYTVRVAPGVRLGYRRNATAGRWSVIAADGKGGSWMKGFAVADDHENSNNDGILDFWQAQDRARILARGDAEKDSDKPATVADALEAYEADLRTRGGDVANVARVRGHLSKTMAAKAVALLTARELRRWRDALRNSVTAATVNRLGNVLRASCNLAADTDERILTRRAWEVGLQALRDATVSRNVILAEEEIRRVVAEAYVISDEFGLLVETAAVTGARISQLARLEAQDVQSDRLQLPSSRKGRGEKKITRQPTPIPEVLAARLQHLAGGKPANAPLLIKPSGEPWKRSDHTRLFQRAAQNAGLDPTNVTVYSLRHSSVTRQLLAGVPTRLVAALHDTSTTMLERTYSKHIADHSDAVARRGMLDLSAPSAAANVVPLPRARA